MKTKELIGETIIAAKYTDFTLILQLSGGKILEITANHEDGELFVRNLKDPHDDYLEADKEE